MKRKILLGTAAVAGLFSVPLLLLAAMFQPPPVPPKVSLNSDPVGNCTVLKPKAEAGLNAQAIAAIAYRVGWRGKDIDIAVAVAKAESGWNPKATNLNSNASVDYGLFQINSIHQAILAGGNWADPEDNARMAYKVWSDAGKQWGPWVTYWRGTYKKYLNQTEVKQVCAPVVRIKGSCKVTQGDWANGLIPASALCQLKTNPNHRLRADAANGFDAMSKAYQAYSGTPLCLTDSYRSLAAQISVKRRKGFLAATPGTSNHGWGLAVDLCEPGTQSNPQPWNTGTGYDRWMHEHSREFGWVHPSWAHAGGSKPEAWHWSFLNKDHAP